MNLLNLAYPYYGNPCEPALTDEFGNDVISDEGIKIYDAKNGNVVKVIPWGECKLLIDQYLDRGAQRYDFECSVMDGPEKNLLKKIFYDSFDYENEIVPSLYKRLRAILPDEIHLQVDQRDYYECALLFNDKDYAPYTFVLENEVDEPLITEDDIARLVDVNFSKKEWAEFYDDLKTVHDPNVDCRFYDITQLMESRYPGYWRRILTAFHQNLANEFPDNEAKVARLLQGRVWTLEVLE